LEGLAFKKGPKKAKSLRTLSMWKEEEDGKEMGLSSERK